MNRFPQFPPARPRKTVCAAHLVIVLVLSALMETSEAGQNGETPSAAVENLSPVQVTATRSRKKWTDIPAAVSRIEREPIRRGRAEVTLNESLGAVPGLFSQNPFNFAQDLRLSLRGFGARSPFGVRGIKIFIDGIPRTLPDGQAQVDSIDPGIIESMEVMRGAASSLYGNASGGVISIHTEDGAAVPLEIESGFTGGQFGLRKSHLKIGGTVGTVNYRVYASNLELDGFREHSRTESVRVQGKIRWTPDSRSGWTLTWGVLRSPKAEDPGALTRDQALLQPGQAHPRNILFDAGERVDQETLGLGYRNTAPGSELTLTAHVIHRDFSNRLPFVRGGRVEFERVAPGAGIRWVVDGKLLHQANRIIVGADTFSQLDDRSRFDNNRGQKGGKTLDQGEAVSSLGLYFRDEFKVSPGLETAAGVRFDRVHFEVNDAFFSDGDQSGSETFSQWSGTLGAVYHLKKTFHLYSNFSTAFEVPTTTELINNPGGTGGFNPGLKPQQSFSYEAGIKRMIPGRWKFDLALFLIRSKNELTPFELPAFPGRGFFRNAGKSERKGLEAQIEYRVTPRWKTGISYTWSDFEFREFNAGAGDLGGRDIPGIPEHRLFGRLAYQGPDGWFARLEVNHAGGFFVDNENFNQNPSHTLAGIQMGWIKRGRHLDASFHLGLNNLLDEAYNANTRINAASGRFFEPGQPFNVFAGITLAYRGIE